VTLTQGILILLHSELVPGPFGEILIVRLGLDGGVIGTTTLFVGSLLVLPPLLHALRISNKTRDSNINFLRLNILLIQNKNINSLQ